jgi:oxalate decarboxylase
VKLSKVRRRHFVHDLPLQGKSAHILTIKPGAMRNLHWNVNANEWHYYLRGKGQVALFGSGGRGKVAEFKPGDVAYIPQGFGHAIKNVGDEDLEIVQTWDNGKFEEIDLTKWVQSSPRYLLANNFAVVPETTIPGLSRHKWRRHARFRVSPQGATTCRVAPVAVRHAHAARYGTRVVIQA